MDQVLKARKLGSASERKRRFLEREQEESHTKELYIEHKKRIMLYDHLADQPSDSESASESDDDSDISRHERQDSVTTPSECSVITPNDTPCAPSAFESTVLDAMMSSEKPQLHIVLPQSLYGTRASPLLDMSPAPQLQASLSAPSDFRYDRYSMLVDAPIVNVSPTDTITTPELDSDDDLSYSPVEIATPVSISLPKTRPAVISISSRSNKKRRTITAQSPLVLETRSLSPEAPPPPLRSVRRLSACSTRSTSSARSGFLACEAQPMMVPELPSNASSIIASAHRDSSVISLNGDGKRSHRKSIQPLLSSIKTGHSRMSSIKSLMKSPTQDRSPSVTSMRPDSRSSRAPTSAADFMDDSFQAFETVPANLYNPPAPRPRTSHHLARPSTSLTGSRDFDVTALPAPLSFNSHRTVTEPAELEHPGLARRKKSFSNLRKHSESIGQAFKFTSKNKSSAGHTPKLSQHISPVQAPPMPQAPSIVVSHKSQTTELSNFPTPPSQPSPNPSLGARSTRSRRSVASYSMFPPSPQVAIQIKGNPGLGLGLKV